MALQLGHVGPYQLQAAIAALHAQAATPEGTDWPQIAALYELLSKMNPSSVIVLNHAVAMAMSGRIEEGLQRIDKLAPARSTGITCFTQREQICCEGSAGPHRRWPRTAKQPA